MVGTGHQYGDTISSRQRAAVRTCAHRARARWDADRGGRGTSKEADYTPPRRTSAVLHEGGARGNGLLLMSCNMLPVAAPPDAGVIAPARHCRHSGANGLHCGLPPTPSMTWRNVSKPPLDTGAAGTFILPWPWGTRRQHVERTRWRGFEPRGTGAPLHVVNVTPTRPHRASRRLDSWRHHADTSNLVPLTGALTTEIRGVHTSFRHPLLPMRLATTNYCRARNGYATPRDAGTTPRGRPCAGYECHASTPV